MAKEKSSTESKNIQYVHSDYYDFHEDVNNLLGKVLTIIDATYPAYESGAEAVQRDAVKSLIKDAFSGYRKDDNWTITTGTNWTYYDVSNADGTTHDASKDITATI